MRRREPPAHLWANKASMRMVLTARPWCFIFKVGRQRRPRGAVRRGKWEPVWRPGGWPVSSFAVASREEPGGLGAQVSCLPLSASVSPPVRQRVSPTHRFLMEENDVTCH